MHPAHHSTSHHHYASVCSTDTLVRLSSMHHEHERNTIRVLFPTHHQNKAMLASFISCIDFQPTASSALVLSTIEATFHVPKDRIRLGSYSIVIEPLASNNFGIKRLSLRPAAVFLYLIHCRRVMPYGAMHLVVVSFTDSKTTSKAISPIFASVKQALAKQ